MIVNIVTHATQCWDTYYEHDDTLPHSPLKA